MCEFMPELSKVRFHNASYEPPPRVSTSERAPSGRHLRAGEFTAADGVGQKELSLSPASRLRGSTRSSKRNAALVRGCGAYWTNWESLSLLAQRCYLLCCP